MSAATIAATVLYHVCILLAVLCGGVLSTCARLQWDPGAYLPLRAVLAEPLATPLANNTQLPAPLAACLAAALALLVTLHVTFCALSTPVSTTRSNILYVVCGSLVTQAVLQAVGVWRAVEAAKSLQTVDVQQLTVLRDHLRTLLGDLARWHSGARDLNLLIDEATDKIYAGVVFTAVSVAVMIVLELAAALLAALAAQRPPVTPDPGETPHTPRLHWQPLLTAPAK